MIEVKFAQLLDNYGVKASQTTKKIAELQNAFDDAWQEYEELIEEAESEENSDEIASIEEKIEEYETELKEADSELVSAINKWYKMKDVWAENARKLADGRANKKNNSNVTQTVNHNQQIPYETPQFVNPKASNGGEVKKKSSGGFWILAGFVAIVTLGSVVMKRD
ncbi:MAG: hypothetical protein ACOVNU_09250 [Candidatus Kapaibacteriota bacterium]